MNNQNNVPNNNNINPGPPGGGGSGWNWVQIAGGVLLGFVLDRIIVGVFQRNIKGTLDKDKEERLNLHKALNLKNSQLMEELKKNKQLQEQHKQLQRKHEQLEEKHEQLQKQNNMLEKSIPQLEEYYKEKEKKKSMVTTLHQVQNEVEQIDQRAKLLLAKVEPQLQKRQVIMCTRPDLWQEVFQIQKDLLDMVANDPMEPKLNLKEALDNIFHYENYCVNPDNPRDARNGRLMWLYLEYWKQQITLQKHKKIEEVLKGAIPNDRNY